MSVIWTEDLSSATYKDALDIRYKVFVEEQNVPSDLEIDELESVTLHVVLYEKETPVATARIYNLDNGFYKVQRVAVFKEHRARGVGAALMHEVEEKVISLNGTKLTLGSQNTAIPFYESLGYKIASEEFMDAGIPHHTMVKDLHVSDGINEVE